MIKNPKLLFFFTCWILCNKPDRLFAQKINDPVLVKYIKQINLTSSKLPIEKLYLQLDKPYYNLGDTIRFKAYLFSADYLTPSTQSGLLYVQLDDVNNKSQKQIVIPIANGTGWGDIALDERDIREGSYTLRAYTNWTKNFGEDYIFKKPVYISANNSAATLVEASFKLDTTIDKNKLQATMRFASLDNRPLILKDMDVRLYNGSRWISRDKLLTDMDGGIQLNFNLRDKVPVKNLAIRAHRTAKGEDTASVAIPVFFNRSEKTDLQFMPEGGYMVEGIKSKIGFKAISEDSRGVNVKGK